MPWNGTITIKLNDVLEKDFCITTGANLFDGSLRIALNKNDLESLTDEELIVILRNFQADTDEIELIQWASECRWDSNYISPSDLIIIANSKIATDEQKSKALELLKNPLSAYRHHESRIKNKKSGFIYLMKDDSFDWLYKIGMSVNPERRLKQVGNASLVHTFPADDMTEAELRLHNVYQNQSVGNEWFKLFEPNIEYIQSIREYRQGDFVIE